MPVLQLGNLSTELSMVSPAGFFKFASSIIHLIVIPSIMRKILCSSTSIVFFLSLTISMHHAAPSTIQPSTSFLTDHWTSPDSRLFWDIASYPLCPDTGGGGKILWIPCINALDKWINCDGLLVCAMCINRSKIPLAWSKTVFPPIDLKTYYTCLSPTCSHFLDRVVLMLCFPWVDAPVVYQHVCECIIPLRNVMFLIPHGRSKDKVSIPFAESTILPTRFVLLDALEEHRQSSILTQLHTPFSRTHL